MEKVLEEPSTTVPAAILGPVIRSEIGRELSRNPTYESGKDAEGEQEKF
jgi:hypothetical protein